MFFKTFAKFNAYLLIHPQRYTLGDYITLSQQVGFYPVYNSDAVRMTSIILFMNDIIHRDSSCSNFVILISELERIGFFIKRSLGNRVRSLFNIPKDNLKDEEAFIKKFKLIPNVDYELSNNRISEFRVNVEYGYSITPMAFYKILYKSYDDIFMGMLMLRLAQIKHYYDLYMSSYLEETIERLKITNKGLVDDINHLTTEFPSIKRSKVFASKEDLNDSYEVNMSNEENNHGNHYGSILSNFKENHIGSSSASPIDIMLEEPSEEKHNINSAYSVHLSEMNNKLIEHINSPHTNSLRLRLQRKMAYKDSDSDLESSKISMASDGSNSVARMIDGMVEKDLLEIDSKQKRYSLKSISTDHISGLKKTFSSQINTHIDKKRSRMAPWSMSSHQ